MMSNVNTDMTKELNLKSIQASLNKKVDKTTKLKSFEDTFNKRLNDNKDSKVDNKFESYNDAVSKNKIKDKDTNDYDNKSDKLDNKIDKLKDKLEKLNDKLDKVSDKNDTGTEKDESKEDIANEINELMAMINELMSQLDGQDNSLDLQKVENNVEATDVIKNPVSTDMTNSKKSTLGSELKEIVKLLEPLKNPETQADLNNIKSVIEGLKETIEETGKTQKVIGNSDFQSSIINELKVALANKSKEKENINNTHKDNVIADDKNISSDNIKVETQNKATNNSDEFKGNEGNNKNSTSSEDKTIKKEENFLDSLVNDKDKNSINKFMPGTVSKLNTFEATLAKTSDSAQSVNKVNVVDGIVKNIKFMQTNDLKELTVSMNPKDLGNMVIKISVEDGKLSAKIIADKKETFDLINANALDVKNALGNVNDKVQQVSVDIQFGDATAYEQFKQGQEYQGNEQRFSGNQNRVVVDESLAEDKVEDDLYAESVVNMLA